MVSVRFVRYALCCFQGWVLKGVTFKKKIILFITGEKMLFIPYASTSEWPLFRPLKFSFLRKRSVWVLLLRQAAYKLSFTATTTLHWSKYSSRACHCSTGLGGYNIRARESDTSSWCFSLFFPLLLKIDSTELTIFFYSANFYASRG